MKKYYEVKWVIEEEFGMRHGTNNFWSENPDQSIQEMQRNYPHFNFYECRQVPHPKPILSPKHCSNCP